MKKTHNIFIGCYPNLGVSKVYKLACLYVKLD